MDADTGYGIIIAVVALGLGAITAKIAADRGVPGSPVFWFIGGAFLAILVLPLAIFSRPDPRKADAKKCPQCAELVKREALICRYCRYEFGPNDDWRVT